MKSDVVVIGGGPSGLTAAYVLSKNGTGTVVLEQDPAKVGGISRTVEYRGFRFDIGGHRFFSKSEEIEDLWTELLGSDMLVRGRLSRIFYKGKFFDYPLKPMNAFVNLGPVETALCILDYGYAKLFPRKASVSFEDWIVNNFGGRLYRTFFKTYTEKVWGIPCNEISADWAAQRIKGLSLASAIKNAFRPQNSGDRSGVIKTLIDEFRYPKFGPGMMWEAAAAKIEERAGQVRMGEKVGAIYHSGGLVQRILTRSDAGENTYEAEHFVSSMPLRSLVRSLVPSAPASVVQAAEGLKYRDFITVALIIDRNESFPDNWIYIHDPSVRVGRIQNFKNWSPYMVPNESQTCLGLEYFCFEGDGLWNMTDKELVALGTTELHRIGIIDEKDVTDGAVVRVPKAYPVYDDYYKENVGIIADYLRGNLKNVQVVGRNGMHKYNNQDHAMMTGILAAKNIQGGSYDVWAVNSDAEYHEEVREERLVPNRISDRQSTADADGGR